MYKQGKWHYETAEESTAKAVMQEELSKLPKFRRRTPMKLPELVSVAPGVTLTDPSDPENIIVALPRAMKKMSINDKKRKLSIDSTATPSVKTNKRVKKIKTAARARSSTPKPKPISDPSIAYLSTSFSQDYFNPKTHRRETLITEIKVQNDPGCHSLKWYHVTFYIQRPGCTTNTKAGYLQAWTLDRSSTSSWIPDLLTPQINGLTGDERPLDHHDPNTHTDVDEAHMMFQNIYHKSGQVRPEFSAHAAKLNVDKLHFIASFCINKPFRGTGLAQKALQSYLKYLPTLQAGQAFEGTVTLSPAGFGAIMEKKGCFAEQGLEVQKKLIRSYEKSGFEVWCWAEEGRFGGGVTIMGQVIGKQNTGEEFVATTDKQATSCSEVEMLDSMPTVPGTIFAPELVDVQPIPSSTYPHATETGSGNGRCCVQ